MASPWSKHSPLFGLLRVCDSVIYCLYSAWNDIRRIFFRVAPVSSGSSLQPWQSGQSDKQGPYDEVVRLPSFDEFTRNMAPVLPHPDAFDATLEDRGRRLLQQDKKR